MPVGKRADEVVDRARPVPVALAVDRSLDFSDPVDELQPVGAGGADRIDHHLAVRHPSRTHHAGARQHRLPAGDAAPHVDAGITRLALVRKKLLADSGVDAVAGDRGPAAHGAAVRSRWPVGKMHADARCVLLDADAMMVGDEPVIPGAGAKGLEQGHLQIAAMDRELRLGIARRAAQRLLIDQLAEAVEKGRVAGLDRHPRQRRLEPERREFPGGMRKQIDANPDRPDLGGGFEDPAGKRGGMQREAECQAADAAANDDDVVHVPFRQPLLRRSRRR